MVDIPEQINYWRNGALEDIDAAKQLVIVGKVRHGLFFAHLALEKILKACVCKSTCKISPKLHNLVRLAEMAGLKMSADRLDFLADMNDFNLEGRYPVQFLPPVSTDELNEYMNKTQETVQWCINQL